MQNGGDCVSTLAEVIAGLRAVLGKTDEARHALNRAGELLDEATRNLTHAVAGSSDQEAAQAVDRLVQAHASIAATYRALVETENRLAGYLNRLTGGNTNHPAPTPGPPRAPDLMTPTRERIERLRAELPPDIPPMDQRRPDEPRRRTHGRWIGSDGQARPVVSGEDEMYAEAIKAFPALGLRRGLPRRASDVEMKLAAYMRNHGISSATVVINNTPCPGPYGCDELVPVLLQEGYTLTVHGPNGFVKTYRGGATPPWTRR